MLQQEMNSKLIFLLMDNVSYEFYCFNNERFKTIYKISQKLDFDSICLNINSIEEYFHIFKKIEINDSISKLRIYYACKY